jgi:tetratricopeptide (TPR) repeat protein
MDCWKGMAAQATFMVACLGVIGCNAQMPPQARQLLTAGLEAYEAGDDDTAVARMDEFLGQYPRVRGAEQAYYLRGVAHYRQGRLEAARADLNEAIGRADDTVLRSKARVALGDLAYDEGDMALAENLYRQALADLARGEAPADHARYRLGCVLQRQGRWAEADQQFNRLIYVFEQSPFAPSAERRVHARAWTVQAGAFNEQGHAAERARELTAAGLPAEVRPVLAEGGPRFVVQVGRHATYEAAAAAVDDVRRREPQAFVTVTR